MSLSVVYLNSHSSLVYGFFCDHSKISLFTILSQFLLSQNMDLDTYAVVEFVTDPPEIEIVLTKWLRKNHDSKIFALWPKNYLPSINKKLSPQKNWMQYECIIKKHEIETYEAAQEYVRMLTEYTDTDSFDKHKRQKVAHRKHFVADMLGIKSDYNEDFDYADGKYLHKNKIPQ